MSKQWTRSVARAREVSWAENGISVGKSIGVFDRIQGRRCDMEESLDLETTDLGRRSWEVSRRARLSAVSYTAAPNLTKKVPDPKVVKPARRTTPVKKRPQVDQAQKQREELAALQEQLSGLQKKLLEKDEALRSAEHLISRISAANAAVDELRGQLTEKESQIESTGSELHGAKIQLAEKQAALEKLEWEAKVSSTKVEELQVDVASMDVEISALMKLFRKITENDRAPYSRERADDSSLECEPVQLDDMVGDIDMEKMEQEMSAYATALAAAKDNPTDEFLKAVTEARLRLQAFVL
ncbi:hypothetical protein OsI_31753 [Oryza sativa Indica Group]|uniref:Uncharacterized protein n=1 Tax=Oryza sativa subsp. indica TaxID=39946 RepID=B8BCR4_ORYSI|nr:hypothetical protein OsI_31753 [Oryza sativa Indica Group]